MSASNSADLLEGFTAVENALLGRGVPLEAARHLKAASFNHHHEDVAETHLKAAESLAPDHAAVLIGLYRFYFYKGRLTEALAVSLRCLNIASLENGIRPDWQYVSARDANFSDYGAILPRFFLFCLKGYAYLNMRLGMMDEGRAAAMKLLELDPTDKIGARILLDVLDRRGLDDEDV